MRWPVNPLVVTRGTYAEAELLSRAVFLGESVHARLDVLHIETGARRPRSRRDTPASTDSARARAMWEELLHRSGMQGCVEVGGGDLCKAAADAVRRRGHDLVIKAGDAPGGVWETLRGTSDVELLRRCPCSAWIIRPLRRTFRPRILLAVDVEPDSAVHRSRNLHLLHAVSEFSTSCGAQVNVVHASSSFAEAKLRGSARLPRRVVDDLTDGVAQERARRLSGLIREGIRPMEWDLHVKKGQPADVIPDLAAKLEADLVVLVMQHRSGLARLLARGVARSVLERIGCSLLCVKTDACAQPVPL